MTVLRSFVYVPHDWQAPMRFPQFTKQLEHYSFCRAPLVDEQEMSFLKRQAPLRLSIHRRLQTSTATNASFRPFKNKSTLELVNSLLVFRLCTIKPLVAATPSIIKTAERLALTYPLYTGIKATFFKHFCGAI